MKKWIPVIIWVVFLGVQIAMKMPKNQILYVQSVLTLVILFIMGYRRGVKRYRSIPEKPLEARLLKERFGHDKSYPDRPVAVGVYEYTLEGKTHRIKLQKMNPGFPDTATLFYRKGRRDIHLKDHDDIPLYYRLLWTLLICPGSAIIVLLVLHYIMKIPLDFAG